MNSVLSLQKLTPASRNAYYPSLSSALSIVCC